MQIINAEDDFLCTDFNMIKYVVYIYIYIYIYNTKKIGFPNERKCILRIFSQQMNLLERVVTDSNLNPQQMLISRFRGTQI